MLRVIFDTNIYGKIIEEQNFEEIATKIKNDEEFKENPEKWLSPTINGGDFRHFSNSDFLKSKIAKSPSNVYLHSSPTMNSGDFCFFDLKYMAFN